MSESDGIPVIECEHRRHQLVFWCAHCRQEHFHGDATEGHRVAHCIDKGSPYLERGYILKLRHDTE